MGVQSLGWLGSAVAAVVVTACTPAPPPTWSEPITGMEFVLVQPGQFQMGLLAPPLDTLRPAPAHLVDVSEPFYLGRFEVTQDEWADVMETTPSQFADCGPRCPVETVSWYDVDEFIARLNARSPGETFRLPTEAEWEYACRAGSDARYGSGLDTISVSLANFDPRPSLEGSDTTGFVGRPTPVGTYPANAWGFADLNGNVWEWTADEFCPYSQSPKEGSVRACGSDTIAIRGGSWAFSAYAARCGRRYVHHREDSGYSIGFRVVRLVPHD